MRKVTTVARAGAGGALALLAVAGCGTATNSTTHSPERITATPSASPSPAAGASGAAHSSPRPTSIRSTCQGAGSTPVRSSGVAAGVPALDAVQFVSATRGWAAGAGRILATSDGGRTWQRQYGGPARLYQVDFTDAAHGWAVGTSALLATSDGGTTWTALPEPCGLIQSVHFVTPSVGYAVADAPAVRIDAGTPVAVASDTGSAAGTDGGRLMKTTDGGHSWNAVTGAPASVESACFTSQSAGYAGTPGRVWRTTDGGAHWSAAFSEPPATGNQNSGSPPDATALECAGPAAAWTLFLGTGAAMSHAPYLAYATQDGRTWRVLFEESYIESAIRPAVHAPNGPGTYPGPFSAISAASAAYVGWTPPEGLGAVPLALVTGTRVVEEGNVGGMTEPYAVAFVSAGQGWVVGADQTSAGQPGHDVIESTANGGRTWTPQYTAP